MLEVLGKCVQLILYSVNYILSVFYFSHSSLCLTRLASFNEKNWNIVILDLLLSEETQRKPDELAQGYKATTSVWGIYNLRIFAPKIDREISWNQLYTHEQDDKN